MAGMRRRDVLAGGAAALAAVQLGCGTRQEQAPAPKARTEIPAGRARLDAPLAKPNGLNLIVIIADTFRTDHVGAYGARKAKTPSLDRLASEGVVFENTYADALPTIPCRRVWHAGRSLLQEKGNWWRPMDPQDVTLAEILSKAGMRTGLVVDSYHYFKPGMNFHQGFDSFHWIRGRNRTRGSAGRWRSTIPRGTCRSTR